MRGPAVIVNKYLQKSYNREDNNSAVMFEEFQRSPQLGMPKDASLSTFLDTPDCCTFSSQGVLLRQILAKILQQKSPHLFP